MLMKNCQKKSILLLEWCFEKGFGPFGTIVGSAQDVFAVVTGLYTSVQSPLSRITWNKIIAICVCLVGKFCMEF